MYRSDFMVQKTHRQIDRITVATLYSSSYSDSRNGEGWKWEGRGDEEKGRKERGWEHEIIASVAVCMLLMQ